MLARTFRTHEELGLLKHEYEALVTTLYMIEDGQIPLEKIYMYMFTELHECGTVHCLAGWAHEIDKTAFPELDNIYRIGQTCVLSARLPLPLQRLFWINEMRRRFPQSQAPARLRTYLETGTCD